MKRQLDSSFEEIEKLGSELDLVSDEHEQSIKALAEREQQYGEIIKRLVQERNRERILSDNDRKQLTKVQELYNQSNEAVSQTELELKNKKIKSLNMTLLPRNEEKIKRKALIKTQSKDIKNKDDELKQKETELNDLRTQLGDRKTETIKLKHEKQLLQSKIAHHKERNKTMERNVENMKEQQEEEKIELQLHQKILKSKKKN